MRPGAALLMALAAADEGRAATAYVTDELVLGVYAAQNTQGQRLATLHSGASVETLAVAGESTQVRLNDGTTGWVKSDYLTLHAPATVRVQQLQDELDRSRATAPGLAEAAARSEVERLQRELTRQADRAGTPRSMPSVGPFATVWAWALTVIVAAGGGFWLGYATLARRIRSRFGGIKVY